MRTTKTGQAQHVRPFTGIPTMIPQFVVGAFTGSPYKIEQVLYRGAHGGARQHLWFAPDPRPHNHPQAWIACACLHRGYRAIEYHPTGDGRYDLREVVLRAGDPEHRVDHTTFHQIVEVEVGTVTVMRYGPTIGDGRDWAHLVVPGPDGPGYSIDRNTSPPGFIDALRHLNPHIERPAGWNDPFAAMPVPTIEGLLRLAE